MIEHLKYKHPPLIFRVKMSINAYFVRILKHARNNLPGREISSNCDYKSKHCEATIKSLCLWGKSEFHFSSP